MLNVDEEIDRESFHCLTEESIQTLIPKFRPRSIFLRNWRKKYNQNSEALSAHDNDTNDNSIILPDDDDIIILISSTSSK